LRSRVRLVKERRAGAVLRWRVRLVEVVHFAFAASCAVGITHRSRPPFPPGRSDAKYSFVPSALRHGDTSPRGACGLFRAVKGSGRGQGAFPLARLVRNNPHRPFSSGPCRYIVRPSLLTVALWNPSGKSIARASPTG